MVLHFPDICFEDCGKEAAGSYQHARAIAEMAESDVCLDRYLWAKNRPEVHFGALCATGVELLLTAGADRAASGLLADAAGAVAGDASRREGVPKAFLCPDCLRRSNAMLLRVDEEGLHRDEFAHGLISFVFSRHGPELLEAVQNRLPGVHFHRER